MIKLCSSVQVSSVLYCQFRSPWLNSCINLANRKKPLIWANSGMHWGGRIVPLQGTHSFFVVSELPWCAQNQIGLSQCPPQPAEFCSSHGANWCEAGQADGDGQPAEERWAVTAFVFPETCVLPCPCALGMAHCPRPFNCMGWDMNRQLPCLARENSNFELTAKELKQCVVAFRDNMENLG